MDSTPQIPIRRVAQHIAVSFAMIAACAEVAVAVASSFQFPMSPIPALIPSGAMCAVGALFALVFSKGRSFFGTEAGFAELFRTFAWLMFLWLPGSMAFACRASVVFLTIALLASSWIATFTICYSPSRRRFIPASAVFWLIGVSVATQAVHRVVAPLLRESSASRSVANQNLNKFSP